MERQGGENSMNGNHGQQIRMNYLGPVKERSAERDTGSEEKGEEVTGTRQGIIPPVMRVGQAEATSRRGQNRQPSFDLDPQELDDLLNVMTIIGDDAGQSTNLASLLSDGPGGAALGEGSNGKFYGGRHYGGELPRNLSDRVQKLVQDGIPTQFLPHNAGANAAVDMQGNTLSKPTAEGANSDKDEHQIKTEHDAHDAKESGLEADGEEDGGQSGSSRKIKDSKSPAAINEKQRRDNMKKLFQELREVVPDTTKADRATVLEMSIKYIKSQNQQYSALLDDFTRLRMQQSLFPLSAYAQHNGHNPTAVIHNPNSAVQFDTTPEYSRAQIIQTGPMNTNNCLQYNSAQGNDPNSAAFNTFAQMRSHLPPYPEGSSSRNSSPSYQNGENYGSVSGMTDPMSVPSSLGNQHYNGNAVPDVQQDVTIKRRSDDIVDVHIQALERRGLLHDLTKLFRSLPLEILQAAIRSTGSGYADNVFQVISKDQRAGDKRARFTREESLTRGDAM